MNERIVYNKDGNTYVVIPAEKSIQRRMDEGATREEAINAIAIKDVPPGINYNVIDASKLPSDRQYRGSWIYHGPSSSVTVSLPKAKVEHMGKLRAIRNEKLKSSDVEYLKATEMGDTARVTALKDWRQRLRDMPQNADMSTITTVDQLKDFTPAVLSENP